MTNPDLTEGLGELEIKPETLRYVVCATSDLLQDASFNVEQWVLTKVSDAFRRSISNAIMHGSGIGMPIGILNPNAGIPICDTSDNTPPGQFTYQDLAMLRMEVPMQWQVGGSYLMNQRTFALLMTMLDTSGRPLPGTGFSFMGLPVNIVSQLPDVAPGATPVAYGNWPQTYLVVTRRRILYLIPLRSSRRRRGDVPGSGEAVADQAKVPRKFQLKRTRTPDNAPPPMPIAFTG